jgi:hypothetical protein
MRITGQATSSMFERYAIISEENLWEAMSKVVRHHKVEQRKVASLRK